MVLTRAFIAIDFSSEVIKEIARAQELLSKKKFIGKLTELENLHLTFKFLGEIDDEKLEKVKEKLKNLKFNSFSAKLGDIGVFHYHKNPRLVWIKVLGKGIWDLQKQIDLVLKDIFPLEERFMSHLTIARLKYVKDKKGFDESLKALTVKDIIFSVENFKLMKSELRELGPVYFVIDKYSLKQ